MGFFIQCDNPGCAKSAIMARGIFTLPAGWFSVGRGALVVNSRDSAASSDLHLVADTLACLDKALEHAGVRPAASVSASSGSGVLSSLGVLRSAYGHPRRSQQQMACFRCGAKITIWEDSGDPVTVFGPKKIVTKSNTMPAVYACTPFCADIIRGQLTGLGVL